MFNLSWLAIVYSQSNLLAPALATVHVLLHLRYLGETRREGALIVAVMAFGVVLDQLMFALGLFTLAGHSSMAPLWLSCLWPVLATTLLHAFSFLQNRWYLASIFGAVGGCGSYLAGTRLTEVAFGSPVLGPALLACLWALLLPALLSVASEFASRDTLREVASNA